MYSAPPNRHVGIDVSGRIVFSNGIGWNKVDQVKNLTNKSKPVPEGDYPRGALTTVKLNEHYFSALLYYLHAQKRWKNAIDLMALHKHHFDDPAMFVYGAILLDDAAKAMENPDQAHQKVKMKHIHMLRTYLVEQTTNVKKFPVRKKVMKRGTE